MTTAAAPSEILINEPETTVNMIATLSTQIEQMSDPAQVYEKIDEVQNNKSLDDFQLGGLLSRVRDEKWYKDEGFTTFKAFLTERFPTIEGRKAAYLMEMYTSLVAAEVQSEDIIGIGWSKLARLAPILTKENATAWLQKARENSVLDLLDMIKAAKAEGTGDVPEIPSEPIVKQNFSLHADQKEVVDEALEKAKVEAETDFDSVALDAICQNYLSGEAVAAPDASATPDLKTMMEAAGFMSVLEIFGTLWPEISLHVEVPEDQ